MMFLSLIPSNLPLTTALVDPSRWDAWFALILVVALAAIAARLLRRIMRCGSAMAGGLLVGLLLGPGFFGRLAPDLYVRAFEGPPVVLASLEGLRREALALQQVAAHTGGDAGEESERLTRALAAAELTWISARYDHRRPQQIALLLLGAAALLAGGAVGARLAGAPWPIAEASLLAAWATIPTALAGIGWAMVLGEAPSAPSSLMIAAILAIGGWRVAGIERAIARSVEVGADRTALLASVLASMSAAVVVAAVAAATLPWILSLALVAAVLALPLGQLRPIGPRLARLFESIALPAAIALGALHIEPFRDFAIWSLLVLFLLAEDGRWCGLLFGDRLAGRRGWLAAMRMALVPLRVGPPMAVVASFGLALGLLAPPVGFAALIAALFVEILAPARLRVARQAEAVARDPGLGDDASD